MASIVRRVQRMGRHKKLVIRSYRSVIDGARIRQVEVAIVDGRNVKSLLGSRLGYSNSHAADRLARLRRERINALVRAAA